MNDEHEHCEYGDDVHEFMLKAEFFGVDEGGRLEATAAQMHTHVHNVPPDLVATSLLVIAEKMVAESMVKSFEDGGVPHIFAHGMAQVAARQWLESTLRGLPQYAETIDFTVPDDLSGL